MHKIVTIVNKVSTGLVLLLVDFEPDALSDAGFDY